MSQRTAKLIVKGQDDASGVLDGIGGSMSGLGSVATGVAVGGLALVAAGFTALIAGGALVAKTVADLTMEAAAVEGTARTFSRLTEEIGGAAFVTEELQAATRGMVSDSELWFASNKFLTMGLTETAEETANMAEMATQLGMAMGEDATASMENFALMMANQSIPRLDSFGISSSTVRTRIAELMDATEGMTREQAFSTAVMEQGAAAMERVGEQGDNAAAANLRWEASIANLRLETGQAFIPVLELLQETFQPMLDEYGPRVVEWAELAAEWLGDKLPVAIENATKWLEGLLEGFAVYSDDIGPAFQEGLELVNDALAELSQELGTSEMSARDIGMFLAKSLIITIQAVAWTVATLADGLKWMAVITGQVEVILAAFQDRLAGGVAWGLGKVLDLATWLKDRFGELRDAVGWVHTKFEGFERTMGSLRDRLQDLRDWVWRLAESLSGLSIPDWLTPGSPTPFENGIRGISNAIASMPPLSFGVSGLAMAGAGGGGSTTIQVNFGRDSVRSDDDIRQIERKIQEITELQGVRGRIG